MTWGEREDRCQLRRKFTGDGGGGLAFFPGNVSGLLASTNHCCHSISWFNNILRTFSFKNTVWSGGRKGGKGERRNKRNTLASLLSFLLPPFLLFFLTVMWAEEGRRKIDWKWCVPKPVFIPRGQSQFCDNVYLMHQDRDSQGQSPHSKPSAMLSMKSPLCLPRAVIFEFRTKGMHPAKLFLLQNFLSPGFIIHLIISPKCQILLLMT